MGGLGIEVGTAPEGQASLALDYMTGLWGGGGAETDIFLPVDGAVHTWRLSYDPNATPPESWSDLTLKKLLTIQRQTIDDLYPKAVALEPDMTREQLHQRLRAAAAEGFIGSFPRRNKVYWALKKGNEKERGAMTFQIDFTFSNETGFRLCGIVDEPT